MIGVSSESGGSIRNFYGSKNMKASWYHQLGPVMGWRRVLYGDLKGVMKGLMALAVVAALAGCQAQSSTPATYGALPDNQPIQLTTAAAQSLTPESVNIPVQVSAAEKAAIATAIEHYRINKGHKKGPVIQAEADLDGDGKPEGLAFFTGESWCAPTGCALTIFRRERLGYVPVSTTKRVKPPILIGKHSTNGWNDLHVKTGGAAYGARFVTLRFSGQGYPGNAITQTPLPADVTPPGRPIITTAPLPQNVAGNAANDAQ